MTYLLLKEPAGCRVARVIGYGMKRVLGKNFACRTCRSLSPNADIRHDETRPFKVMPSQILATYDDEYETLTSTQLDYEAAFNRLIAIYAEKNVRSQEKKVTYG